MKINSTIAFFLLFLLAACVPVTPQFTPRVISVYSTSAATPWLSDLYTCAGSYTVVSRVEDPASADIVLRLGEPKQLSSYAYQIDEEEVLIVTHRQSPVQNLTLDEAQALFMGLGDPSVQIWVYASGEDVFEVFDRFVMKGRIISSSAMVAVDPQQMSNELNAQSNAVGILPRHWKAGDMREVFSVATVPVLATTQSEPHGAVNQIVACLQK